MKHRTYTTEVWNSHTLYATKVSDELNVIKKFLTKYPTEIVIVHMKHGDDDKAWPGMTETHYEQFNKDIKQM